MKNHHMTARFEGPSDIRVMCQCGWQDKTREQFQMVGKPLMELTEVKILVEKHTNDVRSGKAS